MKQVVEGFRSLLVFTFYGLYLINFVNLWFTVASADSSDKFIKFEISTPKIEL